MNRRLFAALALVTSLAVGFAVTAQTKSPVLGLATATAAASSFVVARRGYAFGVDPTDTLTDGGIQHGSQRTAIPTGGTIYVLEKISLRRPSERIVQKNEYGVPSKKAHKKGLIEGTAVLQLPSATATAPAQHSIFALLDAPGPIGGGASVNYILEEVGEEFEHEGETKVNITFSKKLN
jgi:hypothetical protein